MKKNYILLFMILLSGTVNSQAVIFEQPINPIVPTFHVSVGNFSFGSLSDLSVYASDDFNLTRTSNIDKITAYGLQGTNDLVTAMTRIDLFIYSDAAGVPSSDPRSPGTGLLEIVNLLPSNPALTITSIGGLRYEITIDVALAQGSTFSLNAGTYWLVIVPYVDSFDQRVEWFQSIDGTLSGAQYLDPLNLFGVGATTSWTSISSFSFMSSLAFKIEENILSIDEFSQSNVLIHPNPAKDIVNIDLPDSNIIFSTEIFTITGQLVFKSKNKAQLDISKLNSGIYILRISTENGLVIKRLVKE